MHDRPRKTPLDRRRLFIGPVVLAFALSAVSVAWPQQPRPQLQVAPSQQAAPPEPPPAAAPQPSNPGLIEELGKLLKDSASGLKSLPSPGQALDGLNSSAKDATDTLRRIAPLSGQSVATGRTLCPEAANGAPDCKRAADQLCKEKGYASGSGIDIESSQKCSSKAYFSGQGACKQENFVTRAVCQ